jgi:hypothetical protein
MDVAEKETLPRGSLSPVVWVGAHIMLARTGSGGNDVVLCDGLNNCRRSLAEETHTPLQSPGLQEACLELE